MQPAFVTFRWILSIVICVMSICSNAWCGLMQIDTSGDNPPELTCMHYQPVDGFVYNKARVLVNDPDMVWVPGVNVEQGKKTQIEWSSVGLSSRPRKYLVMYRIDPRFSRPQVFIQKFNYELNRYESDFHQTLDGSLDRYNAAPTVDFINRVRDFDNYVNFANREKIPVSRGDVLNITLVDQGHFFSSDTGFPSELSATQDDLANIVTDIGDWVDNKIIYTTAANWCRFFDALPQSTSHICIPPTASPGSNNNDNSSNDGLDYNNQNDNYQYNSLDANDEDVLYHVPAHQYGLLSGVIQNTQSLISNVDTISECNYNQGITEHTELCVYTDGAGMEIVVNGDIIKPSSQRFAKTRNELFETIYYSVNRNGSLDFTTNFALSPLLADPSYNTYIDEYTQLLSGASSYDITDYAGYVTFLDTLLSNNSTVGFNKIHVGRYFFEVLIGRGEIQLSNQQNSGVSVEYLTQDNMPPVLAKGMRTSGDISFNATSDGKLWLRAHSDSDEVTGNVVVDSAGYGGNGVIADLLYNKVLHPLIQKFNATTRNIYTALRENVRVEKIIRTMLTLYIVIYALFFLAGAIGISTEDLVTRVVKIIVVAAVMHENSWVFFHDNVFVLFMEGAAELFNKISGSSSSATNPFGFIDPIFDKFTNRTFWSLIGVQLLQFANGFFIGSLLVIISIIIYFIAIIEVAVSYLMAMVGLAVMISLAPILIVCMLFQPTRGIFDGWVNLCFSYLIQPAILLAFFLLIDGLIDAQLSRVVVDACMELLDINVTIDLRHVGLDIHFEFSLNFLNFFPRYQSLLVDLTPGSTIQEILYQASGGDNTVSLTLASFLMLTYGLAALNLRGYVTAVVSQLTSGAAGVQSAPAASVAGDVLGVSRLAATGAAGIAGGAAAVALSPATLLVGGAVAKTKSMMGMRSNPTGLTTMMFKGVKSATTSSALKAIGKSELLQKGIASGMGTVKGIQDARSFAKSLTIDPPKKAPKKKRIYNPKKLAAHYETKFEKWMDKKGDQIDNKIKSTAKSITSPIAEVRKEMNKLEMVKDAKWAAKQAAASSAGQAIKGAANKTGAAATLVADNLGTYTKNQTGGLMDRLEEGAEAVSAKVENKIDNSSHIQDMRGIGKVMEENAKTVHKAIDHTSDTIRSNVKATSDNARGSIDNIRDSADSVRKAARVARDNMRNAVKSKVKLAQDSLDDVVNSTNDEMVETFMDSIVRDKDTMLQHQALKSEVRKSHASHAKAKKEFTSVEKELQLAKKELKKAEATLYDPLIEKRKKELAQVTEKFGKVKQTLEERTRIVDAKEQKVTELKERKLAEKTAAKERDIAHQQAIFEDQKKKVEGRREFEIAKVNQKTLEEKQKIRHQRVLAEDAKNRIEPRKDSDIEKANQKLIDKQEKIQMKLETIRSQAEQDRANYQEIQRIAEKELRLAEEAAAEAIAANDAIKYEGDAADIASASKDTMESFEKAVIRQDQAEIEKLQKELRGIEHAEKISEAEAYTQKVQEQQDAKEAANQVKLQVAEDKAALAAEKAAEANQKQLDRIEKEAAEALAKAEAKIAKVENDLREADAGNYNKIRKIKEKAEKSKIAIERKAKKLTPNAED